MHSQNYKDSRIVTHGGGGVVPSDKSVLFLTIKKTRRNV